MKWNDNKHRLIICTMLSLLELPFNPIWKGHNMDEEQLVILQNNWHEFHSSS